MFGRMCQRSSSESGNLKSDFLEKEKCNNKRNLQFVKAQFKYVVTTVFKSFRA